MPSRGTTTHRSAPVRKASVRNAPAARGKKRKKGSAILTLAYSLGVVLVMSLLILIAIWVSVGWENKRGSTYTLDYVAAQLQVFSNEPLPEARAFLNENATEFVSSASFSATPKQQVGSQTVSIVMLLTDGTTRTENAELLIVEPVLHLEYGTDTDQTKLLGSRFATATLSQPLSEFRALGTFPLTVTKDGQALAFSVVVADTVAPVGVPKSNLSFYTGEQVSAEACFLSITDASTVQAAFVTAPDTSKNGSGTAQITLTDAAGNGMRYDIPYLVAGDSGAPVFTGVQDLTTVKDVPISYLHGVTASDEKDGTLQVTVSTDAVQLGVPGSYSISYSATDSAGNTKTETANVTVLPADTEATSLSEDTIYRMGYAIVETVLTDDMDEVARARKLYNYVQGHMFYVDNKDEMDWIHAAYLAIIRKYGDCRNYYAYARLLVTCAGFENQMVEHTPSSPTASRHFWNLVKIDGQWYHFDTTPRVGQSNFFMWTDAQIDSYSAKNGNCFARDKSLYPKTP